jgi:hypothetical protein
MSAKPQTKKFGKGSRDVPAATERAQKWYPADDDSQPKTVSVARVELDCACLEYEEDHGTLELLVVGRRMST